MRQNKKNSKKKKSKKPKIYIPAGKIVIFCCVIILICAALLLITTVKSRETPQTPLISAYESSKNPGGTKKQTRRQNKNQNKADLEKSEKTETAEEKPIATAREKTANAEQTEERKNKKIAETERQTAENQKSPNRKKTDENENRQNKTEIQNQKKSEKATETAITATIEQKTAAISQKKSEKEKTEQNSQNIQNGTKKTKSAANNGGQKKSEQNENQIAQKENESYGGKADFQKNGNNFPLAKNGAQLVFVFDDGGQNLSHLDAFLNLPVPITVAVLPRLEFSKQSAQKIRESGNEVVLHQPMQALDQNVNPGAGAVTPKMTESEIIAVLLDNIKEIEPIAGINNHEGSAITSAAEKIEVILKIANEKGVYFLDSRTNAQTKVPQVSKRLGFSYYERNIFLDNEKTKENALSELKRGLDFANKNGSVIMIGHIWSADFLPAFILEVLPELREKGYTFCTVSESDAIKN